MAAEEYTVPTYAKTPEELRELARRIRSRKNVDMGEVALSLMFAARLLDGDYPEWYNAA